MPDIGDGAGALVEAGATQIGTAGWTYDDWAGRFYPKGVRGVDRLDHYVTRFGAVELNASFHRVPAQDTIESWNRRLPDTFHFVARGSRLITHRQQLVESEAAIAVFFKSMGELKTLRAVLWQLPATLRHDLDRIEAFLELLPREYIHAIEFRHESWWQSDVVALLG